MSLSLDRMRALVRLGVGGLSDTELIDADLDEYLNMSLWELEAKYPFRVKETIYETVLVADQFEYSVSDTDLGTLLDGLQSIAVIDSNDKRQRLDRMTRTWLDENQDSELTGFPQRYLREGSTLSLDPIPGDDEDGLTLQIKILESVASMVEGGKEVTGLPRNWDEMVVEGAIVRFHYYREDYNLARQALNFQVNKIKTTVPVVSKEEMDTHRGGLNVQWDETENS